MLQIEPLDRGIGLALAHAMDVDRALRRQRGARLKTTASAAADLMQAC